MLFADSEPFTGISAKIGTRIPACAVYQILYLDYFFQLNGFIPRHCASADFPLKKTKSKLWSEIKLRQILEE
jgi:hypothetical protein